MEKAALKRNSPDFHLGVGGTYKQALRGLFIAGTSSPPSAETTEKVGDEPGLNSDYQSECLE